jgi:hypothetical protein
LKRPSSRGAGLSVCATRPTLLKGREASPRKHLRMDPTEEIQMYDVWSRRGFPKVARLLALLAAAVPSRAQDDRQTRYAIERAHTGVSGKILQERGGTRENVTFDQTRTQTWRISGRLTGVRGAGRRGLSAARPTAARANSSSAPTARPPRAPSRRTGASRVATPTAGCASTGAPTRSSAPATAYAPLTPKTAAPVPTTGARGIDGG